MNPFTALSNNDAFMIMQVSANHARIAELEAAVNAERRLTEEQSAKLENPQNLDRWRSRTAYRLLTFLS
jgi:hypothetical protein